MLCSRLKWDFHDDAGRDADDDAGRGDDDDADDDAGDHYNDMIMIMTAMLRAADADNTDDDAEMLLMLIMLRC